MGRERWGQLLITLGLAALIGSLFAAGATRQIRDTDAVASATPELLEVESVRDAARAEFARAIQATYAPQDVPADTLSMATERMVQNGDIIDDVAQALEVAHQSWLDGGDLVVELDARVVTQAAISGLRDADLDLANAFPAERLVEPEPIAVPWQATAASLRRAEVLALMVAAAGAVMVLVGAFIQSRRSWTLKSIARAATGAGVLVAVVAVVLPLSAVRSLNDVVSIVGALAEPMRVSMLIVAAMLVFAGLWMRASADRVVATVERRLSKQAKRKKEATPVASGGAGHATRKGERHRTEAIDAFFDTTPAAPSERPAVIDLDDLEFADEYSDQQADKNAGGDVNDEGDEDVDAEADDEPVEAASKTPEQERAEAIATERREALERIDGTRTGNRTHLPR